VTASDKQKFDMTDIKKDGLDTLGLNRSEKKIHMAVLVQLLVLLIVFGGLFGTVPTVILIPLAVFAHIFIIVGNAFRADAPSTVAVGAEQEKKISLMWFLGLLLTWGLTAFAVNIVISQPKLFGAIVPWPSIPLMICSGLVSVLLNRLRLRGT
jgi:hypothetical protein